MGRIFYFVNEPLYYYNISNQDSLMHNSRQLDDFLPALQYSIDILKEKNLFYTIYDDLRRSIGQSIDGFARRNKDNDAVQKQINDFLKINFKEMYDERIAFQSEKRNYSNEVVLFGAGRDCLEAIHNIGKERILYVVDNAVDMPKELEGVKLFSPEVLYKEKTEPLILISSSIYYYDIARQLRENGLKNYMNVKDYVMRVNENIL
jgi:hypothetical protein